MAKWTISPGDWCHIDVPTRDVEPSRRFHGEVFGWRFDKYPGTNYVGITTSEDGILSGLGALAELVGRSSSSTGPVPYIRPGTSMGRSRRSRRWSGLQTPGRRLQPAAERTRLHWPGY